MGFSPAPRLPAPGDEGSGAPWAIGGPGAQVRGSVRSTGVEGRCGASTLGCGVRTLGLDSARILGQLWSKLPALLVKSSDGDAGPSRRVWSV